MKHASEAVILDWLDMQKFLPLLSSVALTVLPVEICIIQNFRFHCFHVIFLVEVICVRGWN